MSTEPSTSAATGTDPSAEADAVILPLHAVGQFDPLEAFKVKFVVHQTPMTIMPPIWAVAVTVLTEAGKTIASFVIHSGNKRTVNVPAIPGGYAGPMTFTVPYGHNTFTCTYDLTQGGVNPPPHKTGTYTFDWK